MATFIVGNTRKVFNFGTSKVWDFSEAYRNASDGDSIPGRNYNKFRTK